MTLKRCRIIVFGRVQGVFFRDSTRKKALGLKVHGFVRNLMDGSVEIVVEGPEPAIQNLVKWSHIGPPTARVDRVEVAWENHQNEFDAFEIR